MKFVLISAVAASALVTVSSPTFAQSTPAEAAELTVERTSVPIAPVASDPNGPIVVTRRARTIVATPAIAGARPYDSLIASHAASNGVPVELVHRVVVRESRYRASAMGRGGASGLMQIKLATARGMGYTGSAAGLLDPDTNLTYGVRYLAGAYRAANGHHGRAVGYYASGYYYAAKRQRATTNAYAKARLEPAIFTTAANDPVTSVTREVRRKQRNR